MWLKPSQNNKNGSNWRRYEEFGYWFFRPNSASAGWGTNSWKILFLSQTSSHLFHCFVAYCCRACNCHLLHSFTMHTRKQLRPIKGMKTIFKWNKLVLFFVQIQISISKPLKNYSSGHVIEHLGHAWKIRKWIQDSKNECHR